MIRLKPWFYNGVFVRRLPEKWTFYIPPFTATQGTPGQVIMYPCLLQPPAGQSFYLELGHGPVAGDTAADRGMECPSVGKRIPGNFEFCVLFSRILVGTPGFAIRVLLRRFPARGQPVNILPGPDPGVSRLLRVVAPVNHVAWDWPALDNGLEAVPEAFKTFEIIRNYGSA
jgi:hypothetical protein